MAVTLVTGRDGGEDGEGGDETFFLARSLVFGASMSFGVSIGFGLFTRLGLPTGSRVSIRVGVFISDGAWCIDKLFTTRLFGGTEEEAFFCCCCWKNGCTTLLLIFIEEKKGNKTRLAVE